MKILGNIPSKQAEKIAFTLRLDPKVLDKVDDIAKSGGLSRQKFLESLISQVIKDKNFVLEIS